MRPTPTIDAMAERLRKARERYEELEEDAIVAIAGAVRSQRAELGLDGAVRDVAATTGEDWRVVLACWRTVHPNPRLWNPIAQDPQGRTRRPVTWHFEARADEIPAEAAPCRVCGDVLTPNGRTCRRCSRSLEEDRLERESGR